jgi:hypothetical protein
MTVTGTGRKDARVSTHKKNSMRIIHMAFRPRQQVVRAGTLL